MINNPRLIFSVSSLVSELLLRSGHLYSYASFSLSKTPINTYVLSV